MKGSLQNALFFIAIAINALAVIIGAYFYLDQLASVPAHMLIFVPDCPLYVLLALPIILGLVKNDLFSFIVSVGMVKYGLWTVFVLLFHSGYYFAPEMFAISAVFVIGHIGMALEGLAVLPAKKISLFALALAIAWFLLNDFADYAIGTVPPIPREGLSLVAALTVAASIALPLAFYKFGKQARGLPVAKQMDELLRASTSESKR